MRCRQPARGCGAGWQRRSLSLGGRRSSRAGGHSPAPVPALLPPWPPSPAMGASAVGVHNTTVSSPPASPKPSHGACHGAGFCRPPRAVPAFQDLGKNTRMNVNKCNRTVQWHHPAMETSRSWAGWWEEMVGIRCCLPRPPQPPCGLLRTGCAVASSSQRALSTVGPHFRVSLGEGVITFAHSLKVKPLWWPTSSHSHRLLLQIQMKEGRRDPN